jgi:hypothetical protein
MPVKPSENEEKYFMEKELKRLLEKARGEQEALAAAEKKRLKDLHWMHCPKCGQTLMVENYAGAVEIDVCPGCRGLWLDANELESILASVKRHGPFQSFLKVLGG